MMFSLQALCKQEGTCLCPCLCLFMYAYEYIYACTYIHHRSQALACWCVSKSLSPSLCASACVYIPACVHRMHVHTSNVEDHLSHLLGHVSMSASAAGVCVCLYIRLYVCVCVYMGVYMCVLGYVSVSMSASAAGVCVCL